jgi:hypothetical protein
MNSDEEREFYRKEIEKIIRDLFPNSADFDKSINNAEKSEDKKNTEKESAE